MTDFRTKPDGTKFPLNFGSADPTNNKSYTHPSKCQLCGRYVYYFQSENGGKVVFDDLGPPWPKHSCMAGYSGTKFDVRDSVWFKSGYRPITPDVSDRHFRNEVTIDVNVLPGADGILKKRQLWIPKDNRKNFYRLFFRSGIPTIFRPVENSWLGELSTYIVDQESNVISVDLTGLLFPPISFGVENVKTSVLDKAFNHIFSNRMPQNMSKVYLKEKLGKEIVSSG